MYVCCPKICTVWLNFFYVAVALYQKRIHGFCCRVFDSQNLEEVQFVQLVLEILCHLLHLLKPRAENFMTSMERLLLSRDKSRQMLSISTSKASAETFSGSLKYPALQLCRYISTARDAKIVQYSAVALSHLIVLHQPSLASLPKNELNEFLTSVFRLLKRPNVEIVVELWRFLALCDHRQPRLLDLLINLQYNPELSKVSIVL